MEPFQTGFAAPYPNPRHTAIRWAVGILTLAVLVGAYFVAAMYEHWWPYPTPTPTPHAQVEYRNATYGLSVVLPDNWQGFSVITESLDAIDIQSGKASGSFVEIKLRNPKWTSAAPYEDLPIMVFTPDQWARIASEQLNVSAAPFPPSELAHNSRFVFGLPPRYNYDYALDWDQVQQIVDSHAVQAFEP